MDDKEIVLFGDVNSDLLDARTERAIDMIMRGEVPPNAIKSHPGKGNKVFKYISHVFITRSLNQAFGPLWSTEIGNWMLYDDGSAAVELTLHIDILKRDGTLYRRSITEIGGFESQLSRDTGKPGMPKAMIVSAATSRALARCAMRAFNLGADFYESEDEMDIKTAWNLLIKYAGQRGVNEEQLKEIMKTSEIKQEQLVVEYETAKMAILKHLKEAGYKEVPEDL